MWHDIQLPKALLVWIEQQPGLASWLQALGVIGALFITLYIAGIDRRARSQQRRLRARGLATLLHTQLVGVLGQLDLAIKSRTYSEAAVQPPLALVASTDQLYLLGGAGTLLLQMVATLNANAAVIGDLEKMKAPFDAETWKSISTQLDAAQMCCTGAVAEINQITASG